MAENERVQEQVADIRDAQMGPMIQVVLDADEDPIIFPFSDMGIDAGDPGLIADDDLLQNVEDWLRLERGIDIEPGALRGYKVSRPATNNVMISRPAVFGARTMARYCRNCKKRTLHQAYNGWWECMSCGTWNGKVDES